MLRRVEARPERRAIGTQADPVMLEVFNNLFMSIAEQMGYRLQNTAYSVNIKERLDFSCAIFDAQARLIANAPHMPVHLGSMGESVRTVMNANRGRMMPGDAYVVNDPYHGGTHLPDVTVITPVFDRAAKSCSTSALAATTPTSAGPRRARCRRIRGRSRTKACCSPISNWSRTASCASRPPATSSLGALAGAQSDQNIADMRAQIAANEKGVQELLRMCDHFGLDVVRAYMGHVQDNAEEAVRRVISVLKNGRYEYPLDNGAVIKVEVRWTMRRAAVVDFTGTSPQLDNNFNAPGAIAVAAVLYVFRTLVNDDIPLNDGCLVPLSIVLPEGSMLRPNSPASVVAGNVETSMCIVNALYGALGVLASSQGTMNNFTLGNARHQYYETIRVVPGRSGPHRRGRSARRGFAGTSVVQAHMTNSRLTDPEVLEFRFPVRLESYEIRHGSGGGGRYPGGDGGVRRMRFLEDMTAAILSNNRLHAPFGLSGSQRRHGPQLCRAGRRHGAAAGPRDSAQLRPAMCSWWKRREAAATARCRRWRQQAPLAEASGFPRVALFIPDRSSRPARSRARGLRSAQRRDFAVADLEHGGGQRVLAIGVMPVRAQDRQCALGIVQRCQQLGAAGRGRPAVDDAFDAVLARARRIGDDLRQAGGVGVDHVVGVAVARADLCIETSPGSTSTLNSLASCAEPSVMKAAGAGRGAQQLHGLFQRGAVQRRARQNMRGTPSCRWRARRLLMVWTSPARLAPKVWPGKEPG